MGLKADRPTGNVRAVDRRTGRQTGQPVSRWTSLCVTVFGRYFYPLFSLSFFSSFLLSHLLVNNKLCTKNGGRSREGVPQVARTLLYPLVVVLGR